MPRRSALPFPVAFQFDRTLFYNFVKKSALFLGLAVTRRLSGALLVQDQDAVLVQGIRWVVCVVGELNCNVVILRLKHSLFFGQDFFGVAEQRIPPGLKRLPIRITSRRKNVRIHEAMFHRFHYFVIFCLLFRLGPLPVGLAADDVFEYFLGLV